MDDLATVVAEARTLPDTSPAPLQAVVFHYTQTDSFVALLQQLGGVAPSEHLPGQQAAGRPGRGGRAVHAGTHVRAAHGSGGGFPAVDHRHPQPDLVPAQRTGHCLTRRAGRNS